MIKDTSTRDYVISANLVRRHLNREQKQGIVAMFLKEHPDLSDREIGKLAKVDHKTVVPVRKELEASGEVPHFVKRTDKWGRKRPATKTKKQTEPTIVQTYNADGSSKNRTPFVFEKLVKPEDRLLAIPQHMLPEKTKNKDRPWSIKKADIEFYLRKVAANELVALLVDKDKKQDVRWNASVLWEVLYGYEKADGDTSKRLDWGLHNVSGLEVLKAFYAYFGRTKELPDWVA